MKIMPLFFALLAIQVSLMLFAITSYDCSGNAGDYNDTGNVCFNQNGEYINYTIGNETFGNNDMWDVLFNPWKGGQTRMIIMLLSFAVLVGAVGFIPFINRSDISMLSLPFGFMLVAPLPTIVQLYSFIFSHSSSFFCQVNTSCLPGQLIALLVCGPLLFAWIGACIEWWTGRPIS